MKYQENYPRTMSKCKEVDDLFGGGLTPEAVYEVFGEFGSGKTQFCLSIVAETIAKGDNVVWIDCEDTFKPARLKEILLARELITEDEVEETLSRIRYFHTPNTEQLLGTVNSLSKLFSEIKPTLLIMDGAIGQFREEYLGRGTLADRQNQIARLMTHIKNISYFFKCVVVFTNQVQSDPAVMFGDPIKPIGGNIVGHASTYRIYFKNAGKNLNQQINNIGNDPVKGTSKILQMNSQELEGEVIKEEEKENPTFVQFMKRIDQLPEVTREAIKNCGNDPAIAKAALEISGIDK